MLQPSAFQTKSQHKTQVKFSLVYSDTFSTPKVPKKILQETFYPVHLAAHLGDAELLRLILQAGADATQRTSLGRSAKEVALQNNISGSHDEVFEPTIGGRSWCVFVLSGRSDDVFFWKDRWESQLEQFFFKLRRKVGLRIRFHPHIRCWVRLGALCCAPYPNWVSWGKNYAKTYVLSFAMDSWKFAPQKVCGIGASPQGVVSTDRILQFSNSL